MPRTTKASQDKTSQDSRETGVSTRDVSTFVRERIRTGNFVPGQRLIEADLVRDTGASRAKVREALQRLESEGLVTIEEFRGASVRKLGMDQIRQIYQTRMALEGMAAGECARNGKASLKKQLQKLQRAMDGLERTGDHRRFAQLNDAWHALIIAGSGNGYVSHFLSQLTVPVHRLLFSSFYNAQRIDRANADHKIITQAIVDGRGELAEQAMRDHIHDGLMALASINEKLQP